MRERRTETWLQKYWRPAIAILYIVTCAFDFVIAPIAWSTVQYLLKQTITQWQPLTLTGAGMYHISMGAILGVSAWARGQEKSMVPMYPMPPQAPQPTVYQEPPRPYVDPEQRGQ